jgi:LEA14-like dessication related protein
VNNKYLSSLRAGMLILGFVIITFSSCIKPLSLGKIEQVKVDKMTGENLDIIVTVPIKNPNFFKINVTKMDFAVSINGKLLGSVRNQSHFSISANSDDSYQVPLHVKFENLLTSAFILISAFSEKQIKIRLKGEVTAKSWLTSKTFDVDEENTVDLKQ